MKDYEILLQKLEQNIREHISIEHQLKIQCEKYAEKLDLLEDEKIILLSQLVRYIYLFILIFIFCIFQDDERKEFNEQLEELTKQIDDYLKQKNNFEEQEKKFKAELEKKDNEIIQLQTKIAFLNKKIKLLENTIKTYNITLEEKSKSISNVINSNFSNNNNQNINNSNLEEINDYKKINCTLSQQNIKKKNIRNMKNYYNRSSSSINNNNNSSKNHLNILYNKNIDNPKKINTKKLLLRNMSASNIDPNNIININFNKNNIFSNYNNKNNSINESISNYIYKYNESEFNNISRDNSIKKNNNKNNLSNINGNINKLKLKLPVNITNNNYNMNKNNVMINLSTNIVSNNLNLEKLKVQQKLVEYRKLIDKKINELINNKKRNLNQKKKKTKSSVDKDCNNNKSPKNFDLYKKVSISCLKSDYSRKTKKKVNNVSNTSSKLINNEYFKNIHDKNAIQPKRINHPYDNKKLLKSNSQLNIKIKQSNKKKVNIISKDIDEKGKFNINNFDEDEKDNNIHDQITSKGIDEEKSEDSKK